LPPPQAGRGQNGRIRQRGHTNIPGAKKNGVFYKRLITSHHKNLNKGDGLMADRTKNGADELEGSINLALYK
jgi:hypothetical protein